MRICKYTKAEALMPALFGGCFLWAIGIFSRALDLALWVDVLALLGAGLGFLVFAYRCFATK